MNSGPPGGGVPLRWHDLRPGGPGLFVPADPDAALEALDEATFRATDERMPYFATLWPAGEALAALLLEGPPLAGRSALDLGCGVGAAGLAAAWRGARTTFLDWEPRALELVRRSAAAQALEATCVAADWRAPPPLGPFDLVLAADVLYEARNLPAVVPFLVAHLAPGGEAWLADPGRSHAAGLVARAVAAGLSLREERALAAPSHRGEVRLHRFVR